MTKKTREPLHHTTAFLWLGKAYHTATAAFEETTGVTAARWRLLFLIHRQTTCTQKFLIAEIGVDPGSITRQIKALEAEGLISREPDPKDNRLTLVTLSPKGEAVVHDILEARKRFLERMLHDLPEEELAVFVRVLERISVNLGNTRPLP